MLLSKNSRKIYKVVIILINKVKLRGFKKMVKNEKKINKDFYKDNKTIIKLSFDDMNKNKIIFNIGKMLNKCFDINTYTAFYNNNLENGLKLIFFEQLNKKEIYKIHNFLRLNFKSYGCCYLENNIFKGCVKEYLFKNGCNVNSVYLSQEHKRTNELIKMEL